MLVKVLGLPEVTESGLFAELFGSLLAREFGLNVADVELVHLAADLIEASEDQLRVWGVRPLPGQGIGIEFVRGLAPINVREPIGKGSDALAEAVRLYAFDQLVQNPDRRVENPNCGVHGGQLLPFDFEMTFSFLVPGVLPIRAWEILPSARQHVLHAAIAAARDSEKIDWKPTCDAVIELDGKVDELAAFVPARWQDQAAAVARHLHDVRQHLADFERGLEESLL